MNSTRVRLHFYIQHSALLTFYFNYLGLYFRWWHLRSMLVRFNILTKNNDRRSVGHPKYSEQFNSA